MLLPVAIAIVFTFVLAAPVRALRRAGIHEYAGAGIVIAAVLGVIVLLAMLIAAPAAAWWSRAPLIVHELVEALERWRDALFPYSTPAPLARAPALAPDGFGERLASEGWSFTRQAIGETISFALSASATVILLYFLLASEHWLVTRTIAAIRRPRTRALVLSGFRQAQRDIGLFISTMSIVNLALGIATGMALWLIGLPNPVLWGTTTAVLAFIPYLGPLLIAVTWLAILADGLLELVGEFLSRIRARAQRQASRSALGLLALEVAVAVAFVAPAGLAAGATAAAVDESRDTAAQQWVDTTLAALEPNAVVISWWSYSTPLWYARDVEGRRPDITIIDDRTRLDQDLGDVSNVIDKYLGQRPVYLIREPAETDVLGLTYRLVPLPDVTGSGLTQVVGRQPVGP